MSPSLTREELSEYRSQLRRRHAELRQEIRGELLQADHERYADIADHVHDPGDESVADLLSDLDLAAIDQDVNELRDVEAALESIATGGYGFCIDCGADIDKERLAAQATARRCHDCQAAYERTHAGERHSKL
ncbi:MAG: TraR/DksA family transcriptional regulator [Gammaproteobacteria bacterium]